MAANIFLSSDHDYAGRFEAATLGTGDVPLNKWAWWYRTTDGQLFHVRNRSGILYAVEVNQLA